MAVFGFGHASCEDLKIKRGEGVYYLDKEEFQKGSLNSSSGTLMHLKGAKSSPGYLVQVVSEPWRGPPHHVHGGGEKKRKGLGVKSPGLRAVAPLPPAPQRRRAGGERCGLHLPISRTIKTTFKFFSPALISFIKNGGSLTPFILRQVRLQLQRCGWEGSGTKLPTLLG